MREVLVTAGEGDGKREIGIANTTVNPDGDITADIVLSDPDAIEVMGSVEFKGIIPRIDSEEY